MAITSFLIQQAEINHIDDLIRLRAYLLEKTSYISYACRTKEDQDMWRVKYRQWLYEVLNDNIDIRIYVALFGKKVIGCSTGIIDRRAPARDCISGYCGWIQSVVVTPSFRRQGVAASLLKSLIEWFSEKNISKVQLESSFGSEVFYLAQGFTPEQETLFKREI